VFGLHEIAFKDFAVYDTSGFLVFYKCLEGLKDLESDIEFMVIRLEVGDPGAYLLF
jgi:hypothetical protein